MSAENFSIKSVKGISVCDTNVFIGDPKYLQRQRKTTRTHFHILFSVMHELRKIAQERGTRRGYNARFFLGTLRDLFDDELSGIVEINKGKNFLSIGEKQDPHPHFLIRHGRKNADFWILNSIFRLMIESPSARVSLKTADKKLIERAKKFGIYAGSPDKSPKRYKSRVAFKKGGDGMSRKKNGHLGLFAR